MKVSSPVCTAQFAPSYLQAHNERAHENAGKKHKCDHCNKSFFAKSRLSQHIKIHGHIKEFLCEFCNKSFYNPAGLQSHKLQMHRETGQIFYCTLCNKGFTTRRQFSQHTNKLHQKLNCATCGMTISSRYALKKHKASTRCEPQNVPVINPDEPPIAVMEF